MFRPAGERERGWLSRGEGMVVSVCVCVCREGVFLEREAWIFSNYSAPTPSHLAGQGRQSRARLLALGACSPPPRQPCPSLSPAATVQCTQDHPNRICKPPNEVECKRRNDMRNAFFFFFLCGGGGFLRGEQWMSGGDKVTGKRESGREVNTL